MPFSALRCASGRRVGLSVRVASLSDLLLPDRPGLLLGAAERLVRAPQFAVCRIRRLTHLSPRKGRRTPIGEHSWCLPLNHSPCPMYGGLVATGFPVRSSAPWIHVRSRALAIRCKQLTKLVAGFSTGQIRHTDIRALSSPHSTGHASRTTRGQRQVYPAPTADTMLFDVYDPKNNSSVSWKSDGKDLNEGDILQAVRLNRR